MEEFPIDPIFFNSETGAPFDRCLVCDRAFDGINEDYFIERIFRRVDAMGLTEPIFEYGMCAPCAEELRNELSEQSMQRIENFFISKLQERGVPTEEKRFSQCLLTGKSIDESSEFSFHAHCRGDSMLRSVFPYAISDEGMDQVAELLSNETLDQLDDFKGRYFTGPPELADLLNPKRLIPL